MHRHMQTTTPDNLVHFKDASKAEPERQSRRKESVMECQQRVAEHLSKSMPKLLEQVDDSLFDLAEQSENNTQQAFYFEAMRQICLERAGMETRFTTELLNEDWRRNQFDAVDSTSPESSLSFRDLRLVETDAITLSRFTPPSY